MVDWTPGKFYKFLNQDGKTVVIIEILSFPKPELKYSRANKFWFNKVDGEYRIEFDKIFTGLSIQAEEISRRDIFVELFK